MNTVTLKAKKRMNTSKQKPRAMLNLQITILKLEILLKNSHDKLL